MRALTWPLCLTTLGASVSCQSATPEGSGHSASGELAENHTLLTADDPRVNAIAYVVPIHSIECNGDVSNYEGGIVGYADDATLCWFVNANKVAQQVRGDIASTTLGINVAITSQELCPQTVAGADPFLEHNRVLSATGFQVDRASFEALFGDKPAWLERPGPLMLTAAHVTLDNQLVEAKDIAVVFGLAAPGYYDNGEALDLTFAPQQIAFVEEVRIPARFLNLKKHGIGRIEDVDEDLARDVKLFWLSSNRADAPGLKLKRESHQGRICVVGHPEGIGLTEIEGQTVADSGDLLRYQAYTRASNSGSPVLDCETGEVVAVHNHMGDAFLRNCWQPLEGGVAVHGCRIPLPSPDLMIARGWTTLAEFPPWCGDADFGHSACQGLLFNMNANEDVWTDSELASRLTSARPETLATVGQELIAALDRLPKPMTYNPSTLPPEFRSWVNKALTFLRHTGEYENATQVRRTLSVWAELYLQRIAPTDPEVIQHITAFEGCWKPARYASAIPEHERGGGVSTRGIAKALAETALNCDP